MQNAHSPSVKLSTYQDYTFETERLLIRPIAERDRQMYVGLYSDEKTMRNIKAPLTTQRAEDVFNRVLSAIDKSITSGEPNYLIWTIELKETGQALGLQALVWKPVSLLDTRSNQVVTTKPNEPEIGIMLNRLAQGKQIPYEARKALLHFAFNHLAIDQLYTTFGRKNIPIARLIKRLGFSPDNHLQLMTSNVDGNVPKKVSKKVPEKGTVQIQSDKEYRYITQQGFFAVNPPI